MRKIRVLVADNHPVFREGLSRLFQGEEDLECVATAQDGKEAIRLAQELQPDVAIIDVNMPEISGIDAVKQIKKVCPNTGILMLSAYKYSHYVISSIQAGADGYLVKNIPRHKLVEAIRLIHTGQGVFNLEASSDVLRKLTTGATEAVVSVEFCGGKARLSIADNGVGFQVPDDLSSFVRRGKLGMVSMQERARLVDGGISVKSEIGEGTRIAVEIPA